MYISRIKIVDQTLNNAQTSCLFGFIRDKNIAWKSERVGEWMRGGLMTPKHNTGQIGAIDDPQTQYSGKKGISSFTIVKKSTLKLLEDSSVFI